ncbi:MAG: hypothetical protein ABIQ33_12135 [Caldimonas sp.]
MATAKIRWLLLGLALAAGGQAAAQRMLYRCVIDGKTSLSDRPCAERPSPSFAVIGPAREPRQSMSSTPMVSKAATHLDYLSPLCAELNEGMRNGPARGLGPRALAELHSSYRERCGEDDAVARKRFVEEQAKKRDAHNNELLAEKRERDLVKLTREQCDEMYRIAHNRRKKLEALSPGERADFERFEANRKSRCQPA